MAETLTVRVADRSDLAAIDGLLSRSYPALLKGEYPPSVMVLAVPLLARANPRLVASGSYYVIEEAGVVVGAGGWSRALGQARRRAVAHVRHVVTDHRRVRRGIGRALMQRVAEDAALDGATRLECLSTRTAVPFYAACGFAEVGPIEVSLAPGIDFPAIRMVRKLGPRG